jgi:hypothetical protein
VNQADTTCNVSNPVSFIASHSFYTDVHLSDAATCTQQTANALAKAIASLEAMREAMERSGFYAHKRTIGINTTKEMADELEARASSMHLSTSKYVKLILMQWMDSEKKLRLEEK